MSDALFLDQGAQGTLICRLVLTHLEIIDDPGVVVGQARS